MASISKTQFKRIISRHLHYIDEDTDNWRSCKAVVVDKKIGEMVIEDADLSYSMFEYTYFEGTAFVGVDFSGGIFTDCDFDDCKFVGCSFDQVFFQNCTFMGCVFTGGFFDLCVFDDCNIKYSKAMTDELAKDLDVNPVRYSPTKISSTTFNLCEFTEAFVEPTNFLKNSMNDCRFYNFNFDLLKQLECGAARYVDYRTSFRNCYFATSCENIPDLPLACPSTGSFIAYKKVQVLNMRHNSDIGSFAIAVLKIPAEAKRLSANGNKCRCNKAKVLRFETVDGEKITNPEKYTFISIHDPFFGYKVGQTVKPVSQFCEDRWNECSSGIHFFMNREDAVLY